MTELLDSIHAAVTADATPEARAAGIAACRTILSALEATQDAPLVSATPINASRIASIVGALRGIPAEQLLDLAIGSLSCSMPSP